VGERSIQNDSIIIGGVEDHVHLLVEISTTDAVAKVMSVLKANSSRWIHDVIGMRYFEWQRGYAAFTVSQSMKATLKDILRDTRWGATHLTTSLPSLC
jgi:putative transposase